MVRSNAARLASRLARASFSSHILRDTSSVYDSACARGYRQFSASICDQQRGFSNSILGNARMSARDYYEVLGISKNATASEINKAYLGLAKKLHPDVNKDDPEAATKFQEVQKAYEVLKDDEQRQTYDQLGHDAYNSMNENSGGGAGPGFGGFPGFEELFRNSDIFNFMNQRMGGEDIKISVELSFMEAVQGCTKSVSFQTELPCGACGGSGVPPGTKPETCRHCRGAGMVIQQNGFFTVQTTCPQCKGAGKIVSSFCKTCKGERVVRGLKTVKLDVMPGVDNDETLKVYRSGGADPEGNRPGDLYVTIKVREDPVFRREGSDIHVNAHLNMTQVLDAYRLITEAGSSLPVMDVADYSIVIDGLCKGGQIGWALNLCDFAMSKGVTLNVITYNSVINGLCRQGFLLEAFRIFDSMEKTGIYPSEITYGTLIDALIKEGLLQDSMFLFEKMLHKNIPLNIHVYNSLINMYTKLGDVQNAMELLLDIEAKGLKPDEFTVSTLINGYCQKGDMEAALGLFTEFKGKSISPDFLGFMYLIRGLCAKGRMEESRCILREMLQTQSVTNMLDRVEAETKAESLKSFVSLLCEQGRIDVAVSILNEVGCMYFPVERGHSAFNNISEKPKEPCDREAIDAVECKVTISESKSCNNRQLEMDLENDTDLEANIFHLENFGSYYSLIALYCSKGELNKANILAKKIMSFL